MRILPRSGRGSMAANQYTRELPAICDEDLGQVGKKALGLAQLRRAGFAVPDAFCVSTAAFERYRAARAESGPDAGIPDDVWAEVSGRHAKAFGDRPVAVRSSGVLEDLPDASFAGQYETDLCVRGADALARSLRRCWESVWNDPRPRLLRAQRARPRPVDHGGRGPGDGGVRRVGRPVHREPPHRGRHRGRDRGVVGSRRGHRLGAGHPGPVRPRRPDGRGPGPDPGDQGADDRPRARGARGGRGGGGAARHALPRRRDPRPA